jgi:N-acetyl-gamma-glutamyl-phosphate reductase
MDNNAIWRIGILGVTGYAGRELLSLLGRHRHVHVGLAAARSEVGVPLRKLAPGAPAGAVCALDESLPLGECDVVVCCLPHGASLPWVERVLEAGRRVIDLSADLRVPGEDAPRWSREAVYGLPELHRERIRTAQVVANPGCYPTAALLALAPLLRAGMIDGPVIIDAASGTTGAGRAARPDLLFAEVSENFRAYAAGNVHRHLDEMRDQAHRLGNGATPELVFTPHLLPIRRGILATIHLSLKAPLEDPAAPWREAYAEEPLVRVMEGEMPSIADVAGGNGAAIGVVPVTGTSSPRLTLFSAIDNLGKGAAGQAVQNLNLMLGLPEAEGLL